MNRHYTKDQYIELINKIKTKVPNVALTTDIMVGFPGETEDDFLDTLDVLEKFNTILLLCSFTLLEKVLLQKIWTITLMNP